jgi:hypothetical protein
MLWLVNTYVSMDAKIKSILNAVVVIAVVLSGWLSILAPGTPTRRRIRSTRGGRCAPTQQPCYRSLCSPLRNQHDTPERLPTFDERVCRRRLGERKRPIHHHPQCFACHIFEVTLDHGVPALMVQHQLGTQEDSRQRLVAGAQQIRVRNQ